MMRPTTQLHALAASARLPNLPSVVGNVGLGIALAVHVRSGAAAIGPFFFLQVVGLGVAGVCLYLSGTFLNDWNDRVWDASHRPERALPLGLFSSGFYLAVAAVCGLMGLGCAAAIHPRSLLVAVAIVLAVVLYTWVHKRAAWSVIPMGLCRALLPVMGFVGIAGSGATPWAAPVGFSTAAVPLGVATCACGLFCHVVGLSRSARQESLVAQQPAWVAHLAWSWFAAAAAAMFFSAAWCLRLPLVICLVALLSYGVWITLCLTIFRKPVAVHVAKLLAGIPLVDGLVLWPMAWVQWSLPAGEIPGFSIICLMMPLLAFLLGLGLQRLTPAT